MKTSWDDYDLDLLPERETYATTGRASTSCTLSVVAGNTSSDPESAQAKMAPVFSASRRSQSGPVGVTTLGDLQFPLNKRYVFLLFYRLFV